MNIHFAYANSLSRNFARHHLAGSKTDISVTTSGSLAAAIEATNTLETLDAVMLDMQMPDMNGLQGLRNFRHSCRHKAPIALTAASMDTLSSDNIMGAGAAAFLPYDMEPDALVTVLRLIIAGESYMPAAMRTRQDRDKQLYLTRREQDMLNGLRAGLSNQEIADYWQLSVVTVKHHIKSLRSKLGACNRVHAVCRAIELQI